MQALEKLIFDFVVLPLPFFEVGVSSRDEGIGHSKEGELGLSIFLLQVVIEFFNDAASGGVEWRHHFLHQQIIAHFILIGGKVVEERLHLLFGHIHPCFLQSLHPLLQEQEVVSIEVISSESFEEVDITQVSLLRKGFLEDQHDVVWLEVCPHRVQFSSLDVRTVLIQLRVCCFLLKHLQVPQLVVSESVFEEVLEVLFLLKVGGNELEKQEEFLGDQAV